MLACVVNVSEGRRDDVLAELAAAAGPALLDLHRDPFHHRSVFTLAGDGVVDSVRSLATAAFERLDLRDHRGVHPRIGVVDVVPFVPLGPATMADAEAARDDMADWVWSTHGVPVFLYGRQRSLPDVRREAYTDLAPDVGGPGPHRRWGAVAAGARPPLVAYNVWLAEPDLAAARQVARALRRPGLRALGLAVGDRVQVSMNLTEPALLGPAEAYDAVADEVALAGAELVGLVPEAVLEKIPEHRWAELDLTADRTLEARLARASGTGPG